MTVHPARPVRAEDSGWEWVQRVRLIIQMILSLLILIYDNWPHHEYWPGALIGLGLLAITEAEVILRRWWRAPDEAYVR